MNYFFTLKISYSARISSKYLSFLSAAYENVIFIIFPLSNFEKSFCFREIVGNSDITLCSIHNHLLVTTRDNDIIEEGYKNFSVCRAYIDY